VNVVDQPNDLDQPFERKIFALDRCEELVGTAARWS
jgi:hypothetical protein